MPLEDFYRLSFCNALLERELRGRAATAHGLRIDETITK